MRAHLAGATIILASFACRRSFGGEEAGVKLPSRDKFHLFLLAGQSNMAGRGKVEDEDTKAHPRVLTLTRDGKWAPARDPIHFDKKFAGVGPGRAFGIALAGKHDDVTVGLVPCAAGGSPISTWRPGERWNQTKSRPYDDAIRRTRLAMKDGVLKGILWHQGESDCRPERAALYERNLRELIARFRKDLEAPGLPFIIGQLGQNPAKPWDESRRLVDRAHRCAAAKDTPAALVPSDGLTFNKDGLHFDADSQRAFGRRYAEVYADVVKGVAAEDGPSKPAPKLR